MQIRNRVVLMTGAAGGIGRPLCARLGQEGAVLGLIDRDENGLKELECALTAAGVRCSAATADVRDREQVHAAAASLAAVLGEPDILVAAAGICRVSGVDDLMVPQLEEVLQINFLGTVYAIEAVLPSMIRRGTGQIVGISSLAAVRAIPFEGAYCASKAAVAIYLESIRPPLRRRGVRVTTVFPGFVQTALLDGVLAASGSKAPGGVVSPDFAADKITAAIRRGGPTASFPWSTARLAYLSRWLPCFAYDWIMTRIAAKIPMRY